MHADEIHTDGVGHRESDEGGDGGEACADGAQEEEEEAEEDERDEPARLGHLHDLPAQLPRPLRDVHSEGEVVAHVLVVHMFLRLLVFRRERLVNEPVPV